MRTDNGPELTGRAFLGWAQRHGIKHILTEPRAPTQNGYIESFNGKFRDECLNEHWFETLAQARVVIQAGYRTTTRCGRIGASAACHPGASHACIASKLPMQVHLQPLHWRYP
jgi:transposase InsO family protein